MSENKKFSSGYSMLKIILGVMVLMLFVPIPVGAALTSSNFTIDNASIGGEVTGGIMSSTNFSLTPSRGTLYTLSETDPVDEDEDEDQNKQGSRKKRVIETPNVQPIISAVTTETNPISIKTPDTKNLFTYTNNAVPEVEEERDVPETQEDSPTSENENESNDSPVKKIKNSPFLASLISSDVGQMMTTLRNALDAFFANFYARAATFVVILLLLRYIQTRTRFGRKYLLFF